LKVNTSVATNKGMSSKSALTETKEARPKGDDIPQGEWNNNILKRDDASTAKNWGISAKGACTGVLVTKPRANRLRAQTRKRKPI